MKTVVFGGVKFAEKLEAKLKTEVAEWVRGGGRRPKIASIVFKEDPASRLYTQYKIEAAGRVGIELNPALVSFGDEQTLIEKSIQKANIDQSITGVMIQKPRRKLWQSLVGNQSRKTNQDFDQWWQSLTCLIDPQKDIDGLHPSTQNSIANNTWQKQSRMLPATVVAILQILDSANVKLTDKIIILGRSDIVGRPLGHVLYQLGYSTKLIGVKELNSRLQTGVGLQDADVVISATGQAELITGKMLKTEVVLIDVGEPKPDCQWSTVIKKARFITPVPGGVGPVTVVSLLANAVTCAKIQHS